MLSPSVAALNKALTETNESLARLERAGIERPGDRAIAHMMASMRKQRSSLEHQFEELSRRAGIDVCNYRLFGAGVDFAAGIFRSLVGFQDLLTGTFAAVKSGQRRNQRGRVGEVETRESALTLSHTYSGSAGFVFTMPNERLLLTETPLDGAFNAVFEMAKIDTLAGVRSMAERLGVGVIRDLYAWSSAQIAADLGADIDWRRGDQVRSSVFVEPKNLRQLSGLIDQTSDTSEETITLSGTLKGADVTPKRFHFKPDDGEDIRGTFSDAISEKHRVSLPSRYRAEIAVRTTVKYSTDETQIEHFLVHLDEE